MNSQNTEEEKSLTNNQYGFRMNNLPISRSKWEKDIPRNPSKVIVVP